MTTKCRKCGNLKRKDGEPCAQPCPVDEYGEPCSQKTTGKPPRKTIDKAPLEDELAAMKRKASKAIKRKAAEAREAKSAEDSRAMYRRRLHKIPGKTKEERKWQERCWKLPQHGGYSPEMLEEEGMEWDEAAFEFRKKQQSE